MVPWNSASGGFAYNWRSKWVWIIAIKTEKTQIHFLSDVLVAVAPLDLKVPIVSPHLPGSFTKLVRARKLLFSTFITGNEGTFGCYQQEQFNLPREYSVFDGSQCTVNNRNFKMRRRRESQISYSFTRQNNNFARASRFFVHFFAANCTTTREKA